MPKNVQFGGAGQGSGAPGSDATVTAAAVTAALQYTPAKETDLVKPSFALDTTQFEQNGTITTTWGGQSLVIPLCRLKQSFLATLGASATPTLEALTIKSSTNVTGTNNNYVATTPNGTNWGNTVLWNKRLASGKDGYVGLIATNVSGDVGYGMIGFKDTAAQSGFSGFKAAFWQAGTTLSYIENGSITSSGSFVTANMVLAVWRRGSVFTVESFTDGGTTWVVRKTFTYSNAGDVYPISDIRGDGYINNPKGYNLSTY